MSLGCEGQAVVAMDVDGETLRRGKGASHGSSGARPIGLGRLRRTCEAPLARWGVSPWTHDTLPSPKVFFSFWPRFGPGRVRSYSGSRCFDSRLASWVSPNSPVHGFGRTHLVAQFVPTWLRPRGALRRLKNGPPYGQAWGGGIFP